MKRILITGACGAVGLETLKELVKISGKFKIRVLDLPGKKNRRILAPYKNNIEIIYGSVTDISAVEKAVWGTDIVIHLAAVIPPLADRRPELARIVNVKGTGNIVNAVKKLSPRAFLLYSSSVSVYGDRLKNPWISVEDTTSPSEGDEYGKTKLDAENIVRESGLSWSIFRFTGIMGPNNINRWKIDPLFFHMPLETSFEFATTRDTGFALSRIPYHLNEINGKVFNLAGGAACRVKYRELLEKTFPLIGLNFSKIPKEAFAQKNFHCGFFSDSDNLENILHFQRDTFETYLEWIKKSVPFWKRIIMHTGQNTIIRYMLKHSDPLKALLTSNRKLISRFFNIKPPVDMKNFRHLSWR